MIKLATTGGRTRISWETIPGLDYRLRSSTNLVAWQNDTREITTLGTGRYFMLTQTDVEQNRFFDLLVTAE